MARRKPNNNINATIVDRTTYYQIRIRKMIDGMSVSVPDLPRYNFDPASKESKAEAHRQASLFVLHYKDKLLAQTMGAAHQEQLAAEAEANRVPTLGDWLSKFEDEALDQPMTGLERRGAKQERNLLSRIRRLYAYDLLDVAIPALASGHFATMKSRVKGRAAYNKTKSKQATGTGPNPNSIRRIFFFFATVWNHCDGKHGDMPRPWLKVMPPQVNDERDRVLSAAEWNAIKTHLETIDPLAREAIVFTLAMACRRSETVNLRWSHVRMAKTPEKSELTFHSTKSPKIGEKKRNRTVPIYPEAYAVLERLAKVAKTKSSEARVFSVPADRMTHSFHKAVLAAKIKATKDKPLPRLHDTRHTTATELAKSFDQLRLQKITGHQDPRSLRRYVHTTPAELYVDNTLK